MVLVILWLMPLDKQPLDNSKHTRIRDNILILHNKQYQLRIYLFIPLN